MNVHKPRKLKLFSFDFGDDKPEAWGEVTGSMSHTSYVAGEIWPQTYTVDLSKVMEIMSFKTHRESQGF